MGVKKITPIFFAFMKKTSLISFIFFVLLNAGFSCKQQNIAILQYTNDILIDSISSENIRQIQCAQINNSNYLLILHKEKPEILFFHLDSLKIEKTIQFSIPDDSLYEKKYQFYFHTIDSIFLVALSTQSIYHFNALAHFVNPLPMPSMHKLFNGHFSFMPAVSGIRKINTYLHLQIIRTDISIRTIEERSHYYQTPPCVLFPLDTFSEPVLSGSWPESFSKGSNFRDFYTYTAYDKNAHALLYGYRSTPVMHIFSEKGIEKQIQIKSRYHTEPQEFPDSTSEDYTWLKKYHIEQPRYERLLKNESNNLFFRIYLHKIHYKNEKGYIHVFEDKPFSVIMLDNNYNIINEVLFDAEKYLHYHCFTYSNYLCFLKRDESSDRIQYARFTIEKN